ncbi:hypothetical protein Tco_1433180, partial [Tanacetum coccineum]
SEVTLPPRKRLCITLGLRFEVSESSFAPTARPTREFKRDYGFVATLDDEIRQDPERERDVGYGIRDTGDEMVEAMQEVPATDVAELSQRMSDFVTAVRQDTDEIYGRLNDAQDDRSLMRGQLNLLYRDKCAHARIDRLIESEARLSYESWVQSINANDTTRSKVMALHTTIQMATLQSQQPPARDLAHPDVSEEADKNGSNEKNHKGITSHDNHHHTITNSQLKALIDQGVGDALVARDADRSWNGDDSHNSATGSRRIERTVRECTYTDFLKCQPMNFKGTKGVVGLTQWFERMETVFVRSYFNRSNSLMLV